MKGLLDRLETKQYKIQKEYLKSVHGKKTLSKLGILLIPQQEIISINFDKQQKAEGEEYIDLSTYQIRNQTLTEFFGEKVTTQAGLQKILLKIFSNYENISTEPAFRKIYKKIKENSCYRVANHLDVPKEKEEEEKKTIKKYNSLDKIDISKLTYNLLGNREVSTDNNILKRISQILISDQAIEALFTKDYVLKDGIITHPGKRYTPILSGDKRLQNIAYRQLIRYYYSERNSIPLQTMNTLKKNTFQRIIKEIYDTIGIKIIFKNS